MKSFEPFDWESLSEKYIIGVDEVGRGCLAGPVYAAAVCLNHTTGLDGITDSKSITAQKRSLLSESILSSHQCSIASASVEEIDEINILQASLLAMKRAVVGLNIDLDRAHVLVDGKFTIPNLGSGVCQTAIIKGDLRATPIAAASIIAKVSRDNLLVGLAEECPEYGFEKHKGYSTKIHKEAIETFGPTPYHRKSFRGVKEFL